MEARNEEREQLYALGRATPMYDEQSTEGRVLRTLNKGDRMGEAQKNYKR